MSAKKFPPSSAYVHCNGGCGFAGCTYCCVGCSLCVRACNFGAISLGEDGIARVDISKCIGCGACVKACPQGVISLHQDDNVIRISCSSHDKGPEARKKCTGSCIGCGLCQKVCPAGAVTVIDNLAVIDDSLCLSCGMCATVCPRKVIKDRRGVLTQA